MRTSSRWGSVRLVHTLRCLSLRHGLANTIISEVLNIFRASICCTRSAHLSPFSCKAWLSDDRWSNFASRDMSCGGEKSTVFVNNPEKCEVIRSCVTRVVDYIELRVTHTCMFGLVGYAKKMFLNSRAPCVAAGFAPDSDRGSIFKGSSALAPAG